MAIESCEGGEGVCSEIMVDRFSHLDEGVAHHILSFLNIRDLTCFGIVSKKCRQLCLSSPSLNFDCFFPPRTSPTGEFVTFSNVTCEVRLRLLNSLDRFLLARGDNKIQKFRLIWDDHYIEEEMPCFCVNENFRIITWIHNAVRCNVELLHLENSVTSVEVLEEESLVFPSCIFLSATLRSLVVSINHTIVKTPSFAVSSYLEYLELRNVDIPDEGFFKWISCCCKFIKEIFLCDIWEMENITIESSSLETFRYLEGKLETRHMKISGQKLEKIDIDWQFHSPKNVSLSICAPNLKYLCWRGDVMNNANWGKLKYLEEAAVIMEPKVDDSNNLLEVFRSFNKVEVLVVNEVTIKALFREESMHALLDNLYYLYMSMLSCSDELVPAVVSLLRGMPNLCTLSISYWDLWSSRDPEVDVSGFDMEYWKLQDLECIHQLEEVTIEVSDESNVIELARYLLEHAESLEKMVILYLPEQSDVVQQLNESKRMSKATVIFQEKKARY